MTVYLPREVERVRHDRSGAQEEQFRFANDRKRERSYGSCSGLFLFNKSHVQNAGGKNCRKSEKEHLEGVEPPCSAFVGLRLVH